MHRPHVESHHILVNDLRKFGRVGAVSHQAIDSFEEGGWGGEEFDTDEIAVTRLSWFEMADPGIGHRRLSVNQQTDRLHRLDRQRLMRFNQRAMVREVMHTDRVAGIEGAPEGAKHFEPHSRSSITGRSHHR